ncbi:hypothetical protein [Streptomyces roseus]
MNDPITLAATQDDDPRELHDPDPTGTATASPTSTEPVRTLLETAGTCRPLQEVAELVTLLEETGQNPGHGHQTLRAAAVGRPIQDVALLAGILGTDADADTAHEPPSDPGPAPRSPDPEPRGTLFRSPRPAPAAEPALPARAAPAPPAASVHPADPPDRADPKVPAVPSVHPARPPRSGRPARIPADSHGAAARYGRGAGRRPEPPAGEPFDAPYDDERYESAEYRRGYGRGPDGKRGAAPAGPLRHPLRWPVAAALLLCGALHLPSDVTALSSQTPTAIAALLATVVCIGLGALIAVRDTAGVWRAGAVGAVAVVALHVAGGLAAFDPLEGAVSASQTWAGVAAVLCAAAAAVLAGLALVNREPRARTGAGG